MYNGVVQMLHNLLCVHWDISLCKSILQISVGECNNSKCINPYNAEIFLYIPWSPKGVF